MFDIKISENIANNSIKEKDVIELREQFGYNIFNEKKHQSVIKTFLEEFKNPIIIMLLVASLISFFTESYVSASLIILIILISAIIDFYISHKSQKAAELLLAQVELKAIVIRDGIQKEILTKELLPGDIVFLSAGNVIPADGMVLENNSLYVNESSLTGESLPVEKQIDSEVYLGSGVTSGNAFIKITKIAKETKFYEIVKSLNEKVSANKFEIGIKNFSLLITKVAIMMAIMVFVINIFFDKGILQSLIFSLALAVGITPELLPVIIAINVSRASIRMSKNGVIVKKLSAIENFGGMNILCTDKTGTLTEDNISLAKAINVKGEESENVLKMAYVSSFFNMGSKAILDKAILDYKQFDTNEYQKVTQLPFDFERKRDSLVLDYLENRIIVSKGAPESILQITNLHEDELISANKIFENLSENGYRVLAIASKNISREQNEFNLKDEKDFILIGFIAFMDPPKEGVKEVLNRLEEKNIEIKVITGDHRKVAEKIMSDVGIISKGTLESYEIEAMSDEELSKRALHASLFARVTPFQKNRIIKLLQSSGNTVGYMGDGINDALALRNADVGISVNNATDVAKESADIILLTKSLDQLVSGVIEGRRTFANTVKYITMAVSSNFGNMFSMTLSTIFLPFLPMLPIQILLNNLLYESSELTLTSDNVDEEVLNKPNPWNIDFIKKFMFTFGAISSLFDFLTFFVLYKLFNLVNSAFQTGWFLESFITQTLIILVIRSHKPIFKAIRPHISLVISTFSAVIIAWAIALTDIGKLFDFSKIPFAVIGYILVMTATYMFVIEKVKIAFYKKFKFI